MQVHAVAVPRQRDIAAVDAHSRRRQHMGAVHRHALRLVDGRGIAMVDPVIVLEVEANGSAIVDLHGHGLRADLLEGPERAVLHAKPSFVLQEHDAIPAGEVSLAALDTATCISAPRFPASRIRSRAASLSARTSSLVWVRMIRLLARSRASDYTAAAGANLQSTERTSRSPSNTAAHSLPRHLRRSQTRGLNREYGPLTAYGIG